MYRSRTGLLPAGLFALLTAVTSGAEIELRPISASGVHMVNGNQIVLTGADQQVFLEIFASAWAPAEIKIMQVTIDSSGYSSGLGAPLEPAFSACSTLADCNAAFGGGNCAKACNAGDRAGEPCNTDTDCPNAPAGSCVAAYCLAGFQVTTRADWMFLGAESPIASVDTSSLDYRYGGTDIGGFLASDSGTPAYCGTLVLDVPPAAAGTYTIGFLVAGNGTFLLDENDIFVEPLDLVPAVIAIECLAGTDCNDSNDCTQDVCNPDGTCSNPPNFDDSDFCCDPSDGSLLPLSDGIECTQDVCNAADGTVTHPPEPAFTPCGSSSNTQCDNPDSCDGAGACLPRLEPPGTPCGNPLDTDCNGADTCNGSGVCLTNIQAAGTPCGSPNDSECDDPDTCNGVGTCLSNTTPDNTPCDDGLFCTINERCLSAVCGSGTPRNCADLLTCTTDSCNEGAGQCDHPLDPNRCLIANVCYSDGDFNPANDCEECDSALNTMDWTVRSDGSECNDGDACTGTGRPGIGIDTCTGGVCAGVPDPECNDQCAFAVPAVEGATTSNNASTGPDDGESSCEPDSNGDVWFKYTAVCDGTIFLSTTGSELAPSNDPVLNVFDNCPASPELLDGEIACDDDSGFNLQAALTFAASSGVTYYIRVAGFQDNTGPIVLNLKPIDDCLIDGVCYEEDTHNPDNDCQACVPDLSTTQWSARLEGSSCGDTNDDDCNGPDACDGFGVCEFNFKPDGTVCADEELANECTQNLCGNGACTHPPEPLGLPCGDPSDTECDDPDTCNGGGLCAPNYADFGAPCGDLTETQCDNPDICDGNNVCLPDHKEDGLGCDDEDVCTGSDACDTGVCVGVPIPQAPAVGGLGGLAITVAALPPGSPAPVALHVTSPDWPCLSRYVQLDGSLGDTPVFRLPSEWGTFQVDDQNIVPSSVYEVRAECGAYTSDPGQGMTWLWGDLNNDGLVSFTDINIAADFYKGIFRVPFVVANIHPCPPNDFYNYLDINWTVNAYKSFPYPCASPCLP
jgi:hypothetical protein